MRTVAGLAEMVGAQRACHALDVNRATYYRWRSAQRTPDPSEDPTPDVPARRRPTPQRALSGDERAAVLATLHDERFVDAAPRQVWATQLEEGTYQAHWRTMYRILAANGEVRERRNQLQRPTYQRPELMATAPNQLWSWDITKLRGPRRGQWFYLYLLLDVFSRYVVAWLIAEHENQDLAKTLLDAGYTKQSIGPDQLTIHADRGSPMIAKTVAQLLDDLQVRRSHSRPHVPDDNPFSEAQFKTVKYHPTYPDRFTDVGHARAWADPFIHWYNHDHHHSALALLTPATVHTGRTAVVLAERQRVLDAAYATHPERFVKGPPRVAQPPSTVWINPPLDAPGPDPALPGQGHAVEPGSRGAEGPAPAALDPGEPHGILAAKPRAATVMPLP